MLAFAQVVALVSLLVLPAFAAGVTGTDDSPILEALVVTGAMPGPGLWRVENGDRTLWIMSTVSPLPRNIEWKTLQVDDILGEADAVLTPAGAEADLSAGDVFKMMTLARSANAATRLPGRKKLIDVLPSATYDRWLAMKQRYLPDDRKVDRQRPVFASQALYYSAIRVEGLTRVDTVWKFVKTRAAELDVPVVDTRVRMPLALDRKRYKAGIQALAASQLEDISCFTATLDALPAELETMKRGANAWATGDLDRLLELDHAALAPACKAFYDEAMGFQKKEEWDRTARAAWLAAAAAALAENDITLAVMPIADLLGPSGVLAELRTRSFAVFGPDAEDSTPDAEAE